MNTKTGLLLLAATALVAFALGRLSVPREAAPPGEDLAVAIRAALAEGDVLERFGRTSVLLERLDADNLPEVLAVYDRMLTVIDKWDIRPFVAAWTRFDPAGALDHVLAWPYRIKREAGVEAAIQSWAQSDPLAARIAFEQVVADYPSLHEDVFIALVSGWVHSGGEGLDRFIVELPDATRDSAIGTAVGALMRRGGPDATLAWASGILEHAEYGDRVKLSTFRFATRSVARWDPERAAAWALQRAGEDYAIDGVRIVAEQWGEQDGPAAIQWVREQPEGEQRERAVREGFLGWLKSDPQAARQWLETETLTQFHDPAIDVFARRLDERAPREAVRWCERILGAERRIGCLRTTANKWYQRDALAAEEWLQQSELDEEARTAVRRLPESPQRGRGRARPGMPGGPPG